MADRIGERLRGECTIRTGGTVSQAVFLEWFITAADIISGGVTATAYAHGGFTTENRFRRGTP